MTSPTVSFSDIAKSGSIAILSNVFFFYSRRISVGTAMSGLPIGKTLKHLPQYWLNLIFFNLLPYKLRKKTFKKGITGSLTNLQQFV